MKNPTINNRSLARRVALLAVAMLSGVLVTISVVMSLVAEERSRERIVQWVGDKTQSVADSVDAFDATARLMTDRAYRPFRAKFSQFFELDEAAGLIRIDSAFQDSAKRKSVGRVAIHEYLLSATADLATGEWLTIEPEARILPFSECPGAIRNTQRLIGSRISDIRDEVLAQLRGPEGCTHLNDALRALAEVPKLAGYLAQGA